MLATGHSGTLRSGGLQGCLTPAWVKASPAWPLKPGVVKDDDDVVGSCCGVLGGVEKGLATSEKDGLAGIFSSKAVPWKMPWLTATAAVGRRALRILSECSFWMRTAASSSMAGVNSGARLRSAVSASAKRRT